jgi:polysaccharide chain length determinant protein (PEP-CTERM system associated)
MKPRHESTLLTQSILRPLMAGLAVQPNIEQQIMMLSRTLISRPNLEKLIRMADLDLNVKNKAQQEALIDDLTSSLKILGVGRDNLYTISYRDPDPAKAQKVVQALVSIFIESSLGDKRQDTDSARKFLDEQIRNYEKKLSEAENRLKDFKLRNIDLASAEGKSGIDRLSDLTTQLNMARLQLREAEQSRMRCAARLPEKNRYCCQIPISVTRRFPSRKSMAVSIRKSAIWIPCSSATPSSTPMSSERAD